jgi:hypothetical protein
MPAGDMAHLDLVSLGTIVGAALACIAVFVAVSRRESSIQTAEGKFSANG